MRTSEKRHTDKQAKMKPDRLPLQDTVPVPKKPDIVGIVVRAKELAADLGGYNNLKELIEILM